MKNNIWVRNLLLMAELGKVKIALPIALSAYTGFVMIKGNQLADFLFPFLGVLLLACSAMILNQVQEKDIDSRMARTQSRPLPSGRITVRSALVLFGLFFISGSLLIWLGANLPALATGILTVVCYNGMYTPLKKITAFAAVPGSLVGAFPPMIGWLAGNGNITDHRIILLAGFFFIGQIPHFWLLLLKWGPDYAAAGLPSLTNIFSFVQIQRITFWWIFWTAAIASIMGFLGVVIHLWAAFILSLLSTLLVISFVNMLTTHEKIPAFGRAFLRVNLFYLVIMILIWIDNLV